MADIKCAICGEPWDAYGARHGDMAPWEFQLFKKGAGCPCCKGTAPAGVDATEAHLRSIIIDGGTDDPHAFALVNNPDAPRPKWERPADKVLFECAGCGSKLVHDIDHPDTPENHDIAREWKLVPEVSRIYYYKAKDWPTDPDELPEIEKQKYCPPCATTCGECGTPIFTSHESQTGNVLFGDTYDPGASFQNPRDPYHGKSICITCLEAIPTCGECGEVDDDGTCCKAEENDEGDHDDA